MKIEIICNDLSGCNGYQVKDLNSGRLLMKAGVFGRNFYDDDLEKILSEKQLKQFEEGKYQFEVSGKTLSLIDERYYKPSYTDHAYLRARAGV